jgi:hypothetical protein
MKGIHVNSTTHDADNFTSFPIQAEHNTMIYIQHFYEYPPLYIPDHTSWSSTSYPPFPRGIQRRRYHHVLDMTDFRLHFDLLWHWGQSEFYLLEVSCNRSWIHEPLIPHFVLECFQDLSLLFLFALDAMQHRIVCKWLLQANTKPRSRIFEASGRTAQRTQKTILFLLLAYILQHSGIPVTNISRPWS